MVENLIASLGILVLAIGLYGAIIVAPNAIDKLRKKK